MTCFAFQITSDDVENVLRDYSLRVTNTNGQSFEHMAEELIDELDHERIERAALAAWTSDVFGRPVRRRSVREPQP